MHRRRSVFRAGANALALTCVTLAPAVAHAQAAQPPFQPPPPGWGQQPQAPQPLPPPQQPLPPLQPPPQQQQPYPQQQQQPYPQQQQQPYPQKQQQPYPQQQQQPYPQQQQPQQPGWGLPQPQQPTVAPQSDTRGDGEMVYLYATSAGYGVGTGVGLDLLFKVKDPAVSLIMPLTLGAGVPVGLFFVDRAMPFHRGVPSSTGTGVMLGAMGGFLVSTTQYTLASTPDGEWSGGAYGLLSIVTATGGGIGGFAFGEWLRPEPKTLGFIASSAGWGLLTGGMFGAGVSGEGDTWRGASLGSLLGYAGGIVAGGALSTVYRPSWNSQKWMWLGYGAGAAATSVVYIAYAASDGEPKRGLVANSLGGLAGLTLAAIFSFSEKDDDAANAKPFTPPFQLGFTKLPGGGGMLNAFGTF